MLVSDRPTMKMAYVTTYDSADIHAWSGLGFHIAETLRNERFDLQHIGNLDKKPSWWASRVFQMKTRIYGTMLSKTYRVDRDPLLLNSHARHVEAALSRIDPDIVFSPGTIPIAHLRTDKPIMFWTDATFAGMVNFYPEWSNLCRETLRDGNRMEQEALSRSRLAVYSSDWAAKTAIDNYDVDPRKVKVVPFGANLNDDRDWHAIEAILARKTYDRCQLLFIGVDWFRKGGATALKVAELLNQRGMPTHLQIVGCKPPGDVPSYVTVHGFISKRSAEGRAQLERLFNDSHFLILPTRAECLGVVLSEAASFGLPSLATNVGGISTIIEDGVNGCTFAPDADEAEYVDFVCDVMSSPQRYRELSLRSFERYRERFNWAVAGQEVGRLLRSVLSVETPEVAVRQSVMRSAEGGHR